MFSLILAALALWLLARALSKRGHVLYGSKLSSALLLAFLAINVVSLFFTSNTYPALIWVIHLASYVIIFFLVSDLTLRFDARRFFVILLLASALASAAYGPFQYRQVFPALETMAKENPEEIIGQLDLSPSMFEDFLNRVRSREVFGTFSISNAFAGFLLVTFPIALGLLLERLQTKTLFSKAASASLIFLLSLILVSLYLTRSRLGMMAFIAALAFFLAALLWKKIPLLFRFGLVSSLTILIVAAALYIHAHLPTSSRPLKRDESPVVTRPWRREKGFAKVLLDAADVRLGFWRGALRVIAERPLIGRGYGNFSAHYLRLKDARAHEVEDPHSLYLSTAASAGVFSTLALVAFFLVSLNGAWRVKEEPVPIDSAQRKGLLLAGLSAGAIAFSLNAIPYFRANGLSGMLPEAALAWGVFFMVLFLAGPPAKDVQAAPLASFLTLGIVSGAVGFLIHAGVDVDFSEPGIAQTIFVLLAVLSASGKRESAEAAKSCSRRRNGSAHSSMPILSRVALAAGAGALLLFTALFLWPLARTDRLLADARIALGVERNVEKARLLARESLEEGARLARDARPYKFFAEVENFIWQSNPQANWESFAESKREYERCISLDPDYFIYFASLGSLFSEGSKGLETLARRMEQGFKPSASSKKALEELLMEIPEAAGMNAKGVFLLAERFRIGARAQLAEAVARYPTNPILWKEFGEISELSGHLEEAKAAYRKALELHPLVGQHHLKLKPEELERLEEKTSSGSQP